ncbi:MAG: hypothetical protein E7161_03200 [Firmicutes bacterium]|nr:hypothetical protein [Bacillota bacterium]
MEHYIKGARHLMATQMNCNAIRNCEKLFTEFSKAYYWTNENIRAYLELIDFEGKTNALTVAASGDQAFNLITNGIINIDTFDTNALSEFIAFGFKRAMILKYSYNDFINVMILLRSDNLSQEHINSIISDLLPYMESRHQVFWRTVLNYNKQAQNYYCTNLNLIRMLTLDNKFIPQYNDYLLDELHYETLRKRLGNANITFKCVNAKDLGREFTSQYDLILLSNILDYMFNDWGRHWDYHKLAEYERELGIILKPDGVIFLNYIFTYVVGQNDPNMLFPLSSVTKENLTDEEIHKIPKLDNSNEVDGMILKRIQK